MTDLVSELRTAAESGPLTFYDGVAATRELLKRAADEIARLRAERDRYANDLRRFVEGEPVAVPAERTTGDL